MGCAPSMPSNNMLRPLKQRFAKDNKSDVQLQQEQEQQSEYLIETISDHNGGINCMEISEDRSLLVTGGEDATIRLWATMSSPIECLSVLYGHTSYITCCAIFNCHVISGSADKSIRLWSIDSSDCIAIFKGHQSVINNIVFHERFIFSVSFDKTCRVWDIESDVKFTKNTLHQMNSDKLIDDQDDQDDQVIDASNCCIRVLTGHTKSVTQVIYIPNEHIKRPNSAIIHETDIIVTTSGDSTIRTWSLQTGECLKVLFGHNGPVNCVVVDSVNRRQIYTGGADGVIRCWDTITGELVRELVGHENTVLVLMGHNKILYSGSLDRTARAWVMEFGECTRTFWRNQGGVNCIKYFDGNCSSDTTARVYDAKSGVIKRTFEGHLNGISSLQIAPGKLFTGSFDGKLCVWNCDNINEDTVFGIVNAESEEDLQEDSENIRRAIKALDPYIRNFR